MAALWRGRHEAAVTVKRRSPLSLPTMPLLFLLAMIVGGFTASAACSNGVGGAPLDELRKVTVVAADVPILVFVFTDG